MANPGSGLAFGWVDHFGDELFSILRDDDLRNQTRTLSALTHSKTWGDIRRRDLVTYLEFLANAGHAAEPADLPKLGVPTAIPQEVAEYVDCLLEWNFTDEALPTDDTLFDADRVINHDGYYPITPFALQFEAVPEALAREFGEIERPDIGELLLVPAGNGAALVEALEDRGFVCRRDDHALQAMWDLCLRHP